jgi:hypothetical protein
MLRDAECDTEFCNARLRGVEHCRMAGIIGCCAGKMSYNVLDSSGCLHDVGRCIGSVCYIKFFFSFDMLETIWDALP